MSRCRPCFAGPVVQLVLITLHVHIMHSAALIIHFTGNVTTDFPVSNAHVFTTGPSAPPSKFNGQPSGWQATDIRFAYEKSIDTAYFGTTNSVAECLIGRVPAQQGTLFLPALVQFLQGSTPVLASPATPTATVILVALLPYSLKPLGLMTR